MLSSAGRCEPAALCGQWTLRRRFHDRRAGQFGRAEGTLTITPDAGGTTWQERGRVRWSGYCGEFTRTLLARRIGGEWWMTFADERPFHPWRPGLRVVHPCRADTYRGGVWVPGPDRMRTVWDVVGPGKSQRILTRLSRVPGGLMTR